MTILTIVAAVGSGLVAGVFLAFSTFVMRALARRPAREGLAAMQAINVAVIEPRFLGTFLGTAVACGILAVGALLDTSAPGAVLRLVGSLAYLAGTFLVTIAANVPLNDRLAKLSGDDAGAAEAWADYVRRWTWWNHVRTVFAIVACVALVLATASAPA